MLLEVHGIGSNLHAAADALHEVARCEVQGVLMDVEACAEQAYNAMPRKLCFGGSGFCYHAVNGGVHFFHRVEVAKKDLRVGKSVGVVRFSFEPSG